MDFTSNVLRTIMFVLGRVGVVYLILVVLYSSAKIVEYIDSKSCDSNSRFLDFVSRHAYGSFVFILFLTLVCVVCFFSTLNIESSDEDRLDYESGYSDGISEGYDSAYNDGYSQGYEQGYEQGYDLGREDAMDEGYDYVYDIGYSDGYSKAENDHADDAENGYGDGYHEGYIYGYEDALNGVPPEETRAPRSTEPTP